MAGDGGGVQDVGDERGGAAEGFGYDGSILDQDVMAVVSGDENSAVWELDAAMEQRIMEMVS
ncbi:unnamed protein product [Brassica oleracea]